MAGAQVRIPLPLDMPGRFFVLEWDTYTERFKLYVDDPEKNSYKLDDIPAVMRQFALWKLGDFGNQCIDQAREFGRVQGIPSQQRCINLFDRKPKRGSVFDREEGPNNVDLPPLSEAGPPRGGWR